jgi:hypothetical protein
MVCDGGDAQSFVSPPVLPTLPNLENYSKRATYFEVITQLNIFYFYEKSLAAETLYKMQSCFGWNSLGTLCRSEAGLALHSTKKGRNCMSLPHGTEKRMKCSYTMHIKGKLVP